MLVIILLVSICTNFLFLKISNIFAYTFHIMAYNREWRLNTVYNKMNYLLVSLSYTTQKYVLTSPLHSMKVNILCNKEQR